MAKSEVIVRASAEEIARMRQRGEILTDMKRVREMDQDEVERLADEEDGPLPQGWQGTIVLGIPR